MNAIIEFINAGGRTLRRVCPAHASAIGGVDRASVRAGSGPAQKGARNDSLRGLDAGAGEIGAAAVAGLTDGRGLLAACENGGKYVQAAPVTVSGSGGNDLSTLHPSARGASSKRSLAGMALTGAGNLFCWFGWRWRWEWRFGWSGDWRMVVRRDPAKHRSPEAVRVLLESCRNQLGIKRIIPVRCAAIGSPAICGVLRPVILIPPALAENLDKAEMRSVLLHELAHFKRGDLWVNHVQIVLQIALLV